MQKMKRLSVFLAMIMVLTTVACGNSESKNKDSESVNSESVNSESVNSESTESESSEVVEEDPYFGKFEEPVTISVIKDLAPDGDWTWEDNEWTREWKERFNIEIELLWSTGTQEDFQTKLSMSILDGNLPDVFVVSRAQYLELYEEGKLADITEVYEKYAYPYLKEVQAMWQEGVNSEEIIDGRRYALPSGRILGTNARSIMIRHDYLEAVGAELPTTIEEVIELGKKFVDEGLCKYALLLSDKVVGSGHTDMQVVANAYGAYPNIWTEDEDGKIIYTATTEPMKKTLDLYKELYEDGYINTTFATDVDDQITAYVANGEVGIIPCDFRYVMNPYMPMLDENGDIIEWDILPSLPSETNDDFHVQDSNYSSMADLSYVCINADCENPEAVLRIMNHTCAMINDPELSDNDTWHTRTNEDGTKDAIYLRNPSPCQQFSIPHVNMLTAVAVLDAQGGNLSALDGDPHFKLQYENCENYRKAVEEGDKEAEIENWSMHKLFDGDNSVFYNFYKNYEAGNYIYDARVSKTENYERLWGTLSQYENSFYVNYICGTEDTTFEEFVEEWYKMGGQLLSDELNAE